MSKILVADSSGLIYSTVEISSVTGGVGGGVTSISGLSGSVSISAGTGVSLSVSGQDIAISLASDFLELGPDGAMQGDLDMGGWEILDASGVLVSGTSGNLSLAPNEISSDGSLVISAVSGVNLSGSRISNLAAAVNLSDAVTKGQLDLKQDLVTGGATTIVNTNLTQSRALVSDFSGKVAVSSITSTQLEYLSSVSGDIQTQINSLSGGGSYAPVDYEITGSDIDWSVGDTFFKTISTPTTFTFSNASNGKVISVFIKNVGVSNVGISFPAALSSIPLDAVLSPGQENLFNFIKSNNKIYAVEVKGLV